MAELYDLAPGVLIATSHHDATNTVVLASTHEALLIDPSWTPAELEDLAHQLEERDLRVLSGISTHAHFDHLLWHPRFGAAPRFASRYTAWLAYLRREELLSEWAQSLGVGRVDLPTELVNLFGLLDAPAHSPANPDVIWLPAGTTPSGVRVELIVHDAHVPGHTAVWLPELRILIAGDMLSDCEEPLPDEDAAGTAALLNRRPTTSARQTPALSWGLTDYEAGLRALEPYVRQARLVVPGHGSVGSDALARWERDMAWVQQRMLGEATR